MTKQRSIPSVINVNAFVNQIFKKVTAKIKLDP